MTHKGSDIKFRIKSTKNEAKIVWTQKEVYEDNAGDKKVEYFSGDIDLGREMSELVEYCEGVVRSWVKGDSIRDDAIE